jgi:hypothetical protein
LSEATTGTIALAGDSGALSVADAVADIAFAVAVAADAGVETRPSAGLRETMTAAPPINTIASAAPATTNGSGLP